MTVRFPVDLICGHVNWFRHTRPKPGDVVYCQSCGDYRTVTGVTSEETIELWHVECTASGCIYARHPEDEPTARRVADMHSLRKRHVVQIYDPKMHLVDTILPISGVIEA